MSTKLQGSKATTTTTSTNLRQTVTKSHKVQSSATPRSSASFGAPTTRSTTSASSCNNRRSISSSRILNKTCTNNTKSNAPTTNSPTNKRFITHTNNNSASPFRSFITRGPRIRQPLAQANDFAYDLSKDESKFMGAFKGPMKTVPDKERDLLKSGQRGAYLAVRYEHSPDRKYNYPEATSWRIGWFHNQMTKQGVTI